MKVPVLEKFCGLLDVNTGAYIVGYFSVIGSIIGMISPLQVIQVSHRAFDDIPAIYLELIPNLKKLTLSGRAVLFASWLGLVSLLIGFGFVICLLIGLHKNKRIFIKAYLLFSLVFMVVYFIKFLMIFISTAILSSIWDTKEVMRFRSTILDADVMNYLITGTVQDAVTVVIGGYFILVIWSSYCSLPSAHTQRTAPAA